MLDLFTLEFWIHTISCQTNSEIEVKKYDPEKGNNRTSYSRKIKVKDCVLQKMDYKGITDGFQ